jgi:hypothetical protein
VCSAIPRVNSNEEAITDTIAKFVTTAPSPIQNPIDEYLERATRLVVGSSAAADELLRLYLLGLVSSAEKCFRRLLSGVIGLCECASGIAAKQLLSLAATSYFSTDLGYGLLENAALSGEGELKKRTLAIVGLTIQQNSSLDFALTEFEKLCQLRHAAVHSGGDLSSRNALELDLPISTRLSVFISPLTFQSLVLRCHNAVRAYNQFLFTGTVQRWIDRSILAGEWSKDAAKFTPLYKFFASTKELSIEQDPRKAYVNIEHLVKARNGSDPYPLKTGKRK